MQNDFSNTVSNPVKRFFTAPFDASNMDPDYLRGVWMCFLINFLTKGASKPLEQEGGFDTQHMTHAVILLTISNVYVKAQSMSIILQRNQTLLPKAICFLIILTYDVIANWLLAKQDFKNLFPKPSDEVEIESWIFLGTLNVAYMVFAGIRHYQEQRALHSAELTDIIPILTPDEDTALTTNTNEASTCQSQLTYIVNQTQLPVKFLFGVTSFFYGIMLGEKAGWRCQLPVSAAFYGIAMALTQIACNLLKREHNWNLVLYALACGPAEGLAYFAALNWLPKEMHTIYKATIVALATSASIFLAGNLMFAFLQQASEPEERQPLLSSEEPNDTSLQMP